MLLLWRTDLLSACLAHSLSESFASEAVLGCHNAVDKALTSHVWAVKQLVDVHGYDGLKLGGPLMLSDKAP